MRKTPAVRSVMLIAGIVLIASGCVATQSPATTEVPEVAPGVLTGYLARTALPNSLALLPPPPASDSQAFKADEQTYRSTRVLRDTPRWSLAIQDANLRFPEAAATFTCAIDAPITPEATPRLYMILRRTVADAGFATYAAKTQYQRRRPFVEFKDASCTPQDESKLETDGSYPSGHSAIGWAWALILAELAPERVDAVLARGYAFGQSRVVCGVHWQSDVNAGRVVAAGVVARLHADPAFTADLQAARVELAAVRAQGVRPARDCATEAQTLAVKVPALH